MDHSTPLPSAEPWRAAALVAAVIATVELFILILIGIAFATRFFAGEVDQAAVKTASAAEQPAAGQPAAGTDKKKADTPATKPLLPRRETAVIVLNGNGIAGAASAAADRVRTRGYLISGSANAPRTDFQSSLILFRPGFEREARRLGADVGIRRVAPLDGISKRDLQGAHLALIIGG